MRRDPGAVGAKERDTTGNRQFSSGGFHLCRFLPPQAPSGALFFLRTFPFKLNQPKKSDAPFFPWKSTGHLSTVPKPIMSMMPVFQVRLSGRAEGLSVVRHLRIGPHDLLCVALAMFSRVPFTACTAIRLLMHEGGGWNHNLGEQGIANQ